MRELEIKRQLIHATGLFIALFLRWLYMTTGGWVVPLSLVGLAVLVGYGISTAYLRDIRIPGITEMIQRAEREKDRHFPVRGAIRFFTGIFLTILVFRNSPEIFTAGIIVLSLGDSASTLLGMLYGRHRVFYNRRKSYEGTGSGILAAFLGLMIFTPFSTLIGLLSAFTGMVVESLPIDVDDNLTVPLSASLIIWVAMQTGINI